MTVDIYSSFKPFLCFSRTQINITKLFAPIMIEVLIVFIVILIINVELTVDIYSSCKPSVHRQLNYSKTVKRGRAQVALPERWAKLMNNKLHI
jgi:hypothetical protein